MQAHSPPNPHPLDFDWRFTGKTVQDIVELLSVDVSTIAVGVPSVARRLEHLGQDVLLVDRQPLQGVRNQLAVEVNVHRHSVGHFAQAIVDPPWYPNELQNWIAWTANQMEKKGTIFVSIWPDSVRQTAHSEVQNFISWAKSWAELEMLSVVPTYEEPIFEQHAAKASIVPILPLSPRQGRLLKLSVRNAPDLQIQTRNPPNETWVRFVLDDYQLAIRLDATKNVSSPIAMHPGALGWNWPYVSRRAPKRDQIGLWSSDNEVALVQKPAELLQALRAAFAQQGAQDFEDSLGSFALLKEWNIPRPPYKRSFEWQHH